MSAPTPTAEQRRVIEHPLSPLLVVAGAGTGKTFAMSRRILHLVETEGVAPHQILGLTFTNKAAANLEEQVRQQLGPDTDITVSTYHSFGASLVADHHIELGLAADTRVLNRAQAWMLLYSVFDTFAFDKRSTLRPGVLVNDALQLASRLADHLVDLDDLERDCNEIGTDGRWKPMRETAVKRSELCQVIRAYAERKRAEGFIDFADQIALAVSLVRDHPGVAAAVRDQYAVVLLDEYQDTNYAQRVLLQTIWPAGSPVTAVGDDMQSIYAFRGAHLANLLRFGEHFPPCVELPLETNRRSGPAVVELANRIQAQIPGAMDKTLRAEPDAPATTIECFVAADDHEEAHTIAAEIAARGGPWRDNAVLCRKRRIIPAIVDALEAAGVPVDEVGGGGLNTRPEIVDLVAWLEVLAERRASVAILRVLEGPRYRIGRSDLGALARHARAVEVASADAAEGRPEVVLADVVRAHAEVADLSAAGRSRLAAFEADRTMLDGLAARLPVLDLCEAVAQRTGLWAGSGPKGRENLLRFFELAADFAPVDGVSGLKSFVEYIALLEESEETLAEARTTDLDAVRVMTIHQAKGLEFPNVYLAGLAGGQGSGNSIFPDNRLTENPIGNSSALPYWLRADAEHFPDWRTVGRQDDIRDFLRDEQRCEEWRLLYVSCTRAMERLVCSTAQWYPGPAEPQGPSAFYEFVAAQTDIVTERFRHDPAEVDPAAAARERQRAAGRPLPPPVTDDPPDTVVGLVAVPPPPAVRRPPPATVSVTDLVSHARCPRQFFWSVVRPLPRRTSRAASIGTEVHRRIEARADGGLVVFEEFDDTDGTDEVNGRHEVDDPDAIRPGARHEAIVDGYLASFDRGPFTALDPVAVEAPFELQVGSVTVRGRIDAIYERDGRIELVDFKTGALPASGDPCHWTQVSVYAVAAARVLGHPAARLRSTFCRLQAGGDPLIESIDWDAESLDRFAVELDARCADIGAGDHPTRPGAWCGGCPFAGVCPDAWPTGGGVLSDS